MKPPRPAREITDAMTIAEIQDAWQRELEQANASTAGTSPAEVRDPTELDRLAAEFAESIGATLEEKPTKAAELDDGEKLRALLRNRDGP
jgi:hypothetical protein